MHFQCPRAHLPVLVVDDGSHDDTPVVAGAAGATVVRHPRNLGKGAALMTGFAWALERGYRAVLTLDANGQHDPADVQVSGCLRCQRGGSHHRAA
jgi:glycosyltransferase involved in cell wall biosynthesis